jgi:HD-like signal output (HDOD) protein
MSRDEYLTRTRNYIAKMPALPVTVSKVMEICNNPATSPSDLNTVIGLDPVLMARVLKLINSAYYGMSQQVTSLVRAIIMLGINTVKNLALSTAVLGNIGRKSDFQALNMQGFWRHSLCVGVASKLIARKRKVDPKSIEEYFIAGLLHDIGKIPMNNALAKEYVETMAVSGADHSQLVSAEKEHLGLDHCEVGSMIGEAWKLGGDILDTIRCHHEPGVYTGTHRSIVYTVAVANFFANVNEIGFSGNRYPENVRADVLAYLGIDLDFVDGMAGEITQEIEKAQVFLKISQE